MEHGKHEKMPKGMPMKGMPKGPHKMPGGMPMKGGKKGK